MQLLEKAKAREIQKTLLETSRIPRLLWEYVKSGVKPESFAHQGRVDAGKFLEAFRAEIANWEKRLYKP